MGATKRVAELLILGLQHHQTRFVSVRFGNVLGSRGSVLPVLQQQIAGRSPITITIDAGEALRKIRRMAKAVFDNLSGAKPKNHFTIGIHDDVTETSLSFNDSSKWRERMFFEAFSSDSAPTAPWERTRTRSRSSAQKRTALSRGISLRL
jgi:hypothetical protein